MIVNMALNRVQFGPNTHDIGLDRILKEGIIKAAFPLHDVCISNKIK